MRLPEETHETQQGEEGEQEQEAEDYMADEEMRALLTSSGGDEQGDYRAEGGSAHVHL